MHLGLCVCLWAAVAVVTHAQLDRIKVSNQQFVDRSGRVRIFHGINSVKKSEPYYSSFTDEELNTMANEWGFNLLRLGFSWEGYERSRGNKDEAYMKAQSDMVTRLADFGIYTVVDVHQDLYSRVYCGNGFPAWTVAVQPDVQSAAPFPIPVLGRDVSYELDPTTGIIRPEDCARSYWGTYYFSNVTGSIFESFYRDRQGIQTAFVDMWRDIAVAFTGRPEVFGYEIINEPFPGNIYTDYGLFYNSTYADLTELAPLYDRVHRAIRPIDNDAMLLFEPMVSNSELAPRKSGLQQGPGGAEYRDRDVYAFHFYCTMTTDRPEYCNRFTDNSFAQRQRDADRMGLAKILTEFGYFSGNSTQNGVDTSLLCDKADETLVSWLNWEYGNVVGNQDKIRALARTYAQAIAGYPTLQRFNGQTGEFTLEYRINKSAAGPTEIFVPVSLFFPRGVDVSIIPSGFAQWTFGKRNVVFVTHTDASRDNELLSITIRSL